MIGYIKGTLLLTEVDEIIVENQNMGFRIRVPGLVLDKLPEAGSEVMLYTYMYVREDEISLFGFLSQDELRAFKLLLTVNGVGPKGALGILSVLSCRELALAVHGQDAKAISKAPGIGAKTAQRVILDMKGRLDLEDAWKAEEEDASMASQSASKEAVEALTALGYGVSEATAAVKKVSATEDMTVEEYLKNALKHML